MASWNLGAGAAERVVPALRGLVAGMVLSVAVAGVAGAPPMPRAVPHAEPVARPRPESAQPGKQLKKPGEEAEKEEHSAEHPDAPEMEASDVEYSPEQQAEIDRTDAEILKGFGIVAVGLGLAALAFAIPRRQAAGSLMAAWKTPMLWSVCTAGASAILSVFGAEVVTWIAWGVGGLVVVLLGARAWRLRSWTPVWDMAGVAIAFVCVTQLLIAFDHGSEAKAHGTAAITFDQPGNVATPAGVAEAMGGIRPPQK